MHDSDRDLAGVLHEDRDGRLAVAGGDQPALDGERAYAREDIAAVLALSDESLIDEHLQEQVVDIDPVARRPRHDGYL